MKRSISPPSAKRVKLERLQVTRYAPSIPPRPIHRLSQGQLRIFSWNINGIDPFLQPAITTYFTKSSRKRQRSPSTDDEATVGSSFRTCLARWQFPQIVGLQEVKIRPGDEKTMGRVRKAVATSSKTDQSYRAFFSLPRDKYNAKGFGGKVYGVAMLVREDVIDAGATVSDIDWDLEGRILVLKLPKHKIAVFNVYAVNGTDNPYRNPNTGEVEGTRHDRKRQFHSDLHQEIQKLEADKWSVIVAGDLNIARSLIDGFPGIRMAAAHIQNRADFESKFISNDGSGLCMLDTFRHLHDDERKYSYRSRGVTWGASCDRVDLILASRTAGSAVSGADILDTILERGPSDHVPIYVTLELD
ncbi:MAG: hypothetical protein GOMPHAMPRED_004977 [Gomphillus americanus]|uniref:Endonuclease/exonuclease/phosphatase domain-containing protein n=1 Tax=Gomphillus americanus TaxID=1940652 RepID=A0A8H3EKI6_9LECA|nr:MAG: hypothetical protein GOMPHAMPRED_004977 [Gomphillus americanus]